MPHGIHIIFPQNTVVPRNLVINPVVGCHYFMLGQPLISQLQIIDAFWRMVSQYQTALLGDRDKCVNNLPTIITWNLTTLFLVNEIILKV